MLKLDQYGPVLAENSKAEEILLRIKEELKQKDSVVIDMAMIKLMQTRCAHLIFGSLYLELGAETFYRRIQIQGATPNIRTVILAGIEQACKNNNQ